MEHVIDVNQPMDLHKLFGNLWEETLWIQFLIVNGEKWDQLQGSVNEVMAGPPFDSKQPDISFETLDATMMQEEKCDEPVPGPQENHTGNASQSRKRYQDMTEGDFFDDFKNDEGFQRFKREQAAAARDVKRAVGDVNRTHKQTESTKRAERFSIGTPSPSKSLTRNIFLE